MKPIRYPARLTLVLAEDQRDAVQALAKQKRLSLGEAARELLVVGIQTRE